MAKQDAATPTPKAAAPGAARDNAIRRARAAGIPWPLILAALLQGLPVLLQLIEKWLNPQEESE